ncbi:hypothetical protein [Frigidibacter sp. MR17.24]|uniref:hypothetical protein n=1 Tax=Frigidibacter sp. MR17.24 TaxID=3127345 RepID=UPI0030131640
MKPAFALSLAPEGIVLLERDGAGWLAIGEVAFDQEDAEGAIADLAAIAHRRQPGRVASKLILPQSQILYMTVEAPGPDAATRRRQIARALEGRTPYPVDGLVYDWSGTGGEVRLAVVARETLDEAEAFAEAQGFNPVSFVALPDNGQFAGEPWFGQAASARRWIPEGERLVRDQDPIRVTGILDLDAPLAAAVAEQDAGPDLTAAEDPRDEHVEDVAGLEAPEAPQPAWTDAPDDQPLADEPEPVAAEADVAELPQDDAAVAPAPEEAAEEAPLAEPEAAQGADLTEIGSDAEAAPRHDDLPSDAPEGEAPPAHEPEPAPDPVVGTDEVVAAPDHEDPPTAEDARPALAEAQDAIPAPAEQELEAPEAAEPEPVLAEPVEPEPEPVVAAPEPAEPDTAEQDTAVTAPEPEPAARREPLSALRTAIAGARAASGRDRTLDTTEAEAPRMPAAEVPAVEISDAPVDPSALAATLDAAEPVLLPGENEGDGPAPRELAAALPHPVSPGPATDAPDDAPRAGLRVVTGERRETAPASLRGAMKRALGFGASARQAPAAPAKAASRRAEPPAQPRIGGRPETRPETRPIAAERGGALRARRAEAEPEAQAELPEIAPAAGILPAEDPAAFGARDVAVQDLSVQDLPAEDGPLRAAEIPADDSPADAPPIDDVPPAFAAPRPAEDARWIDDVPPMPAIRMPAHGAAGVSVTATDLPEPRPMPSVTAPKLGIAPEPRESHAAPRPPKGGKRVETAEGRRQQRRGRAEPPALAPGAPEPGSEVDERANRAAEAIARSLQDKQAPARPRHLGLVLTAGLIVLMLAVALGSVLFDDATPVSGEAGTGTATTAATGDATGDALATASDIPSDAELDAGAAPETAPETAPVTGTGTAAATPPETATEAEAPPAGPPPATDSQAPRAQTAQQAGPDATQALPPSDAEPRTALQAPGTLSRDAGLAADAPPAAPQPSLPYGTQFTFGPDGLVVATPEGALTPDGAVVRSGRPPVVPPARPGSTAAAAPAATAPQVSPPGEGQAATPASAALAATPTATQPPPPNPAPPAPAAAAAAPPAPQTGLVFGPDLGQAADPPPVRPAGLAPATPQDDAALTPAPAAPAAAPAPPYQDPALAGFRPRATAPAARTAAAAAQAEADRLAEAEAAQAAELAAASRMAVQSSRKPAARPTDFSQGIAEALALAVATPVPDPVPVPVPVPVPPPAPVAPAAQPAPVAPAAAPPPVQQAAPTRTAAAAPVQHEDEIDEPEPVGTAPAAASSGTVASRATIAKAISLREMNLIGIYGSSSSRRALVRLSNGRYLRVSVGDRLDGGRVQQIGDGQLVYVKNGRTQVLRMIRDS